MPTQQPVLKGAERTLALAIAAIKAGEIASGTTFSVGGTSYTLPDLLAKLETVSALFSTVRELRLALTAAVAKRRSSGKDVRDFLEALRAALVGLYGVESTALVTFGFKLRKPAPKLTGEQILAKAAKAKATRVLRHTLGPKQKASIKAEGSVVVTAAMSDASSLARASEAESAAPKTASSMAPDAAKPSSAGAAPSPNPEGAHT